MKVLVLVSDRISPAMTAVRVRNFYLWQAMQSLGVEVRILGLNRDLSHPAPFAPNNLNCDFIQPKKYNKVKRLLTALTKSFHEWPRSNKLIENIRVVENEWKPDVIHAEEMRMAYYLPCFQERQSTCLQTVTFHNVETDLIKKTGSSPFKFGKTLIESTHRFNLKKYEQKVIKCVDFNFAFSKVDLEKYKQLYPGTTWEVTSNGTNASEITVLPQESKRNLLIVGSLNYAPNVEGLFWFIDNVWSKLAKEFHLVVAGSRATQEVRDKLMSNNIEFVDTPESLDSYFEEATICVVPVFKGSGTRGKILESLAQQRLVITSKLGVEGLPFNDSNGVVIAKPEEFEKKIVEWANDQTKREKSAKAGRNFVLENFDWKIVAEQLLNDWKKNLNCEERDSI